MANNYYFFAFTGACR